MFHFNAAHFRGGEFNMLHFRAAVATYDVTTAFNQAVVDHTAQILSPTGMRNRAYLWFIREPDWDRSDNCWAVLIDTSGIAGANTQSELGKTCHGTVLVAPDTMLCSSLSPLDIGTTIEFFQAGAGPVSGVTADVFDYRDIGTSGLRVLQLNGDVPSIIHPIAVMSPESYRYFPIMGDYRYGRGILGVWIDYAQLAYTCMLNAVYPNGRADVTASWDLYSKAGVTEDIGLGAYLVYDSTLILIGLWNELPNQAISVIPHIAAINAAMTAMGSAHQLTVFDMSTIPGGGP